MIKEQLIKIKIVRNSMKEYYESKGYKIDKLGQEIYINSKDISNNSHIKITYICDYCGEEFERMPYSNSRSNKDGNFKDSCIKCSRKKRAKETCLKKYSVDNPMKVEEIQLKCEKSRALNNQNFNGSKFNSCQFFENGIPVSKAQGLLKEFLPEYELNYHLGKYYIDLFHNNICIEYDGKGHDLGVRMNKISLEDFLSKENEKKNFILKNNRLLKIIDKKDFFKNEENIHKYINEIKDFIESDEIYKEIIIS